MNVDLERSEDICVDQLPNFQWEFEETRFKLIISRFKLIVGRFKLTTRLFSSSGKD